MKEILSKNTHLNLKLTEKQRIKRIEMSKQEKIKISEEKTKISKEKKAPKNDILTQNTHHYNSSRMKR